MTPSLLPRYLLGLAGTLVGAAGTEFTGSMLPLALGASFTLLVTFDVVRRLRVRSRRD